MEFFAEHRRKMENALGLAMTGGGARGAYQAGVLKRIGEIQRVQTNGNPFPIIGGSSAGAINGSALAAGADDFALTTKALAHLWASLRPTDVFRCDVVSQRKTSVGRRLAHRWARALVVKAKSSAPAAKAEPLIAPAEEPPMMGKGLP